MTAPTLFHPLVSGLVPLPAEGHRAIFFNPPADFVQPRDLDVDLTLVQGFRPAYLQLLRSGGAVFPAAEEGQYDLAFVLAGRHRRQNEAWLAEALSRMRPGGLVFVSGTRSDGIQSLRRRVADLMPIAGSASKYHGVAFWLERPADGEDLSRAVAALSASSAAVEGAFVTAPGGFSADRIDPGSRLLADSLPTGLKGIAADFCAGWGYLSTRLAQHEGISAIDLYEADHASLAAAKINTTGGRPTLAYYWHDLLSEPVPRRYDVVVMNPPFHASRAADPALGAGMIAAASKALRPKGRLFLVANRGLPYEKALSIGFARSGEVRRDASFKVLWAER